MLLSYKLGQGSIILRVKIRNSSVSTGAGLTGLTSASAGLRISTIADNEATPTVYTVAGGTIESITTLGTYATPTATKCRFKLVDDTNHPGVVEVQLDNTRYNVTNAKSLLVSISGATNAAECDALIPLTSVDPYVANGKAPVTLAATDVTGNVPADIQTIKTQTVTCSAAVTIGAFVGNATAAIAVDASGYLTLTTTAAAALVDAVWDEVLTGATHNIATSAGRRLRELYGVVSATGAVNDAAASTTTFITNLTSTVNDFYANQNLVMNGGGTLDGQSRVILSYNGTTKAITVDEAFTSAPENGHAFTILSPHIHPISQIQAGLATPTNITSASGIVLAAGTHTGAVIPTVTTLTNLPAITANWLTAAGIAAGALNGKGDWLTTGGYSTPPTAAAIATAVWTDVTASDFTAGGSPGAILVGANGVESGVSLKQAIQRIGATTAGKLSGSQTSTEVYVGLDGTTVRVTVTADSVGNRSAVAYG